MTDARQESIRFVALAAREILDGQVCFVGVGVPSLAAMAAKRRHAPNAVLVYESGAVDTMPPTPPLSTGSPSVVADAAMVTSCLGIFSMLQQGYVDRGLLSGAQVDRFGNLNSTRLVRRDKPPLRLVGSGGAHDIALLARDVLIMMPHEPRRFVETVDFVTSPGLPKGSNGAPRGKGPSCLITPRARFTFETGELTLEAVADGLAEDEAVDGIPWQVPRAAKVRTLPPIEPELLDIAGELLDKCGRDAA
jgi:glutaconate CoA-transferase, subunit B